MRDPKHGLICVRDLEEEASRSGFEKGLSFMLENGVTEGYVFVRAEVSANTDIAAFEGLLAAHGKRVKSPST